MAMSDKWDDVFNQNNNNDDFDWDNYNSDPSLIVLKKTVENNTKERDRYASYCKEHGLFMIDSKANFVAIDFKGHDAQLIAKELLQKGIIVRPLLGYKLQDILRISIGTKEENDRLFNELSKLLETI